MSASGPQAPQASEGGTFLTIGISSSCSLAESGSWRGTKSSLCGHCSLSSVWVCLPTLGSKVLARLAGGRQSRVSLQSNLDILLGFCSLPQTRCQVGIGWGQELLRKSKQQREEAPGGDTGLS